MYEPKLEVRAELRELTEKTIDHAEEALRMFFDAANKSIESVPGTQISKQGLLYTEQSLKTAFNHARQLVNATDLQQAFMIQSEYLRSQIASAGRQMQQIANQFMESGKVSSKDGV